MRRLLSLSLVLGSLSLAACNPKPGYPECKADADCTDHGQVCVAGFCKECRDDGQCKAGQACRDNACAATAQCTGAKDCQPGQKCAAGKCTAECAEATAASDCGAGRKCLAGRCAAQEECVADADCGSGSACENAVCRAQGSAEASTAGAQADCELKPVHFGFDDATVSSAAREALEQDLRCLSRGAGKVEISGHTDERGTTEYNLALGSRRAAAVRKYLIGIGADKAKLHTVSFGKEKPLDPGHDERAWSKNRRVELTPGR